MSEFSYVVDICNAVADDPRSNVIFLILACVPCPLEATFGRFRGKHELHLKEEIGDESLRKSVGTKLAILVSRGLPYART